MLNLMTCYLTDLVVDDLPPVLSPNNLGVGHLGTEVIKLNKQVYLKSFVNTDTLYVKL